MRSLYTQYTLSPSILVIRFTTDAALLSVTARRQWYVERQQRWLQLRRFHPEILRPQYNSAQNATRDSYGKGIRFTLPTVAHSSVYVEGKAQLAIFGLLRQ